VVAVFDQQARTAQDRVGDLFGTVVGSDDQAHLALGLFDGDAAGCFCNRRDTLRGTGFEELLDTGQTLGDVVATAGGNSTTGVERTHGQLGTGLTDGLCGDDAHGLADVHGLAGGQRTAVAQGAGADAGLTGEHGADLDLGDAGLEQLSDHDVTAVGAGSSEDLALGVHDVDGERTGVGTVLDVLVQDQLTVRIGDGDRRDQATLGAAVLFADDDVLRHVHQTTGQVTRVGGTQRGVGQTLTGTVRRDEVFQHRQALTVGGLDRTRDDFTLRVGHQATDTRDLADLHPVTTCTGGHHAVDGVHRRQAVTHRLGDFVGCLVPDLDQFLATLVVVDQALVVLALDLGGPLLVTGEDLPAWP
jgi:hypothetical protein